MGSIPVFVGLDYHQKEVQVCVMDARGRVVRNKKVENRVSMIVGLIREKGEPSCVAVEACCGSADLAEKLHQTTGWSVSLAHPGYTARMKQNPDKTDFGDARLLADLLRVGYLPKVWLAPEEIRQLRRMVRYRQQLVDQRRDAKLRIRALLRENRLRCPLKVSPWTKAWLAWVENTSELHDDDRWLMDQHLKNVLHLSELIAEAEQRLQELAADDAMIGKLMSFKGVGLITALTIRAEIGRFDRFQSGKQLARFCGLTPKNASSGERQADAGLIRAGNRQLRAVLIQLAHRLVLQKKGRWTRLADRMLGRGKPKNVIIAAVANRFMRWLYHQMQPQNLAA